MSLTTDAEPSASPQFVELSAMQRQLWASQRRHPLSGHQNTTLLSTIGGEVDPRRLAAAFATVVAASDVLRSQIMETSGATVVWLNPAPAETVILEMERDEMLAWASERAKVPLDMTSCGFDSVIIQHQDSTTSWYLNLHHVITDATASANVFAETAAVYFGAEPNVASYYNWANELGTEDARLQRATAHWRDRQPLPRIGALYEPVGRPQPASRRTALPLSPELRSLLEGQLADRYRGISPDVAWTNFLLTAAALYVHRVTGATELAVGLPVHNRSGDHAVALFGPLMQMFPVDIRIRADDTFSSLHKRVAKSAMRSLRNARPGAAPSTADVEVVVNVIPRAGIELFGEFPVATTWIHPGATDPNHLFQLQLTTYSGGSPRLSADINAAAATPAQLGLLPEHFLSVVRAMVTAPDDPIGSHAITSRREEADIRSWGDRRHELPSTALLVEQLANQLAAAASPTLSDRSRSLTGPELLEAVERTAGWLRDFHNVAIGDRVAIQMPRTIDSVIAIIACWWAGASYVPIDPQQPERRRRALIERAGCKAVITQIHEAGNSTSLGPPVPGAPDREAYLLFTSGSTGEAKGVPITHRGVADYIHFARSHYLKPHEAPVVALFSALTFDLTVTSLFLPLISGGELIVIEPVGVPGLREIADTSRITWIKATPSHAAILNRMLPPDHRLTLLVLGGEALSSGLADQLWLQNSKMQIYNEYGPTEAVVGCMVHQALPTDEWPEVPIGVPAPGVELRIVDRYDHVVPVGSPGELLISHRGLTSGYLGAEPGTGPFVDLDGCRFYRSGDLVRFVTPDLLTYLGRIDEQVKVGGIRLDPTEVEHQLDQHAGIIRSAVRLYHPPSGPPVLTAWFETEGRKPPAAELRLWLTDRLPAHAVPAAYVPLDRLPTTSNGKLNNQALPAPSNDDRPISDGVADKASDLEIEIMSIWAEMLGIEALGPNDAFFDLGGDSLAGMQSVLTLAQRIGRAVAEELIFEHRTARELAAAIQVDTFTARPRPTLESPPSLEDLPLTPGESAMVFEWLNDPDRSQNNVGRTYEVTAEVDPNRLLEAAHQLIARHGPLRLTLIEPRTDLSPQQALDFTVGPVGSVADFTKAAHEVFNAPYDLISGPLVRILVQPLHHGGTGILVAMHHAVIDEAGLDAVFADLDRLYHGQDLPPLSTGHTDGVLGQIEASDRPTDRKFWLDRAVLPASVTLPPGIGHDGYRERRCSLVANQLDKLGSSRAAVCLAALATVIRRYSNGDGVEIGVPISTRPANGSDLTGYWLNTLPIIVSTPATSDLDQLSVEATAQLAAVMQHRRYPLASLVRDRRSQGLPVPSLNILLAYSNLVSPSFDGQAASHRVLAPADATTDLSFFVQVRDDNVMLGLEYSGRFIDGKTADRLLEELENALTGREIGPGVAVIRSEHEPLRLPVPPRLLHEVVAEQVRKNPGGIAVSSPDAQLTYAELDARANGIAKQILAGGTSPRSYVGVVTARRVELVAGILGVLKAGCAYVPIDPEYPPSRISSIVKDSGLEVVIAHSCLPPGLEGVHFVDISSVEPQGESPSVQISPNDPPFSPNDTAYAIFTSGSTGRPKGVAVSHANISYSTMVRPQVYRHGPKAFLLLSSFAFDSSMVGLWWTLCTGGEVVLPDPDRPTDVHHLGELIERRRVTHLLAVPALYAVLLGEVDSNSLVSLSTVIVAGEACPPSVVAAHFEALPKSELHNEYGPTETTVWSHHHRFDSSYSIDQPVPIGRPIPGSICLVLDPEGNPVGGGDTGELFIGGPGVTAGYIDQPELTAERFVDRLLPDAEGLLYRTGDLVRRLQTGELAFVGRADDQVKIRGYRIELGEIENALGSHPRVQVAAVRTVSTSMSDRLAAWFVPRSGQAVSAEELRTHLAGIVPEYMVPASFTQVDRMPVTPNGKIDRAALPDPAVLSGSPVRPATLHAAPPSEWTPIQRAIGEAWEKVLVSGPIGLHDNYFDLGGDSILSIRIVAGLRRQGIRVKPRDLFDAPTIAALAEVGSVSSDIAFNSSRPVGEVPLLPMQRWFFEQDFANPDHWNQSMWLEVSEPIDVPTLSHALDAVVAHHDVLRASFEATADGWCQRIHATGPAVFVQEFRNLNSSAIEVVAHSVEASLHPATAELVAAAVFRSRSEPDRVLLTVHHLVMDGVSWRPFIEDVSAAYECLRQGRSVQLPRPTSSVADWAQVLGAAQPDPAWTCIDLPRPSRTRYPETAGRRHTVAVESGAIDGLLDRLLAAVALAHQEVFGWDRLTATLEGHGRAEELNDSIDLSRTIGWFTTLYPIDVAVDNAVEQSVAAARTKIPHGGVGALGAFGNRLPRFVINYLGQTDKAAADTQLLTPLSGIEAGYGATNHRTHDLGILAHTSQGMLHVTWDYVPTEHPTALIEQAARRFEHHFDPTGTRLDLVDLSPADLNHIAMLLN